MAIPPMHRRVDSWGRKVRWCHYHERQTGESRTTHLTQIDPEQDVWEMRVRELKTNKEIHKREGIRYEDAAAYLATHALVV